MKIKKLIALAASFTTLLASVPLSSVFADEQPYAPHSVKTVNDDISFESTSSMGDILSAKAEAMYGSKEENNGCIVSSVEMAGKTAHVTFDTPQECDLLVAVYDNEGKQMLGSGTISVLPAQSSADVELTILEMPKYFFIRAYLVETGTHIPLSRVYENPNYTSEMAAFFEVTADDFEPERVVNFDSSNETNFAVYDEDTVRVPAAAGENIIDGSDEDILIISSPSSEMKNIAEGNIVSIDGADGQPCIFKAEKVERKDGKLFITQGGFSVDEVFDFVKLESDSAEEGIEPDYSVEGLPDSYFIKTEDSSSSDETNNTVSAEQLYADPSFEFELDGGVNRDEPREITLSGKVGVTAKLSKSIEGYQTEKDPRKYRQGEHPSLAVKADCEGSISVSPGVSFKFYFNKVVNVDESTSEKTYSDEAVAENFSDKIKALDYFELRFETTISFDVTVTDTLDLSIPLAVIAIPIHASGFVIKMIPTLNVSVSGSVRLIGEYTIIKGVRIDHGKATEISEKKDPKIDCSASVTVKIGLDLSPSVVFITKYLFESKLIVKAELVLKGECSYGTSNIQRLDGLQDVHCCYMGDEIPDVIDRTFTTATPDSSQTSETTTTTAADNGTLPRETSTAVSTAKGEKLTAFKGCLVGNVDLVGTIGVSLEIAHNSDWKLETTFSATYHLGVFYYSEKYQKGGFGVCPHKLYSCTVTLKDKNDEPIKFQDFTVVFPDKKEFRATTDEYGKASVLMEKGNNTIQVNSANYLSPSKKVNVNPVLTLGKSSADFSGSLNLTDKKGDSYSLSDSGLSVSVKNGTSAASSSAEPTSTTTATTISTRSYGANIGFSYESPKFEQKVYFNKSVDNNIICSLRDRTYSAEISVVDSQGTPVPNAKVDYKDSLFSNKTDKDGKCRISLPSGEIQITVDSLSCGSKTETIDMEAHDCSFVIGLDGVYDPSFAITDPGKISSLTETGTCCGGLVSYSLRNGVLTLTSDTTVDMTDTRFSGSAILSVVINGKINSLGENIFRDCKYLETVSLSRYNTSELKNFGKAFTGCTSLRSAEFTGESSGFRSEDGVLYYNSGIVFYPPARENTEITVNGTVGESAFSDCMNIKKIIFDSGSIDRVSIRLAVNGCPELTEVEFTDAVKGFTFSDGVIYGVDYSSKSSQTVLKSIIKAMPSVSRLNIADSINTVYSDAFDRCNIEELTLYNRQLPFAECVGTELKKLTVRNSSSSNSVSCGNSSSVYAKNFRASKIPSLETVVFEDGITEIGESWFEKSNVADVILPESVTKIKDKAFASCKIQSSLKLGNSAEIGTEAFRDCSCLSGFEVGEKASVGIRAFDNCTSLASVKIGASSEIGSHAFNNCKALTSIELGVGTTNLSSDNIKISDDAFSGCNNIKMAAVPGDMSSYYLAYSFDSIEEITLLYSKGTLRNGVPFNNEARKRQSYNDAFSVDYRAYNELPNLYPNMKKITVCEGFTEIPDGMFANLPSDVEISLPAGITKIGEYSFYGCKKINDVSFMNDLTKIGKYAFAGCGFTELLIPEHITSFGEYSFAECEFTNLVIPDNITSVSTGAFDGCEKLESAVIGPNITSATNPFSNCSALKEITVNTTGDVVLDDIDTVRIGAGVDNFNVSVRAGNFIVDSANTVMSSENGLLLDKTKETLIRYPALRKEEVFTPPESITAISQNAFTDCNNLIRIEIPDTVTSVYTITNCKKLEYVRLPDSLKKVNYDFSDGCTALKEISIPSEFFCSNKDNSCCCFGKSSNDFTLTIRPVGSKELFGLVDANGKVVVEEGITDVSSPFANRVTSVALPESLETIGKNNTTSGWNGEEDYDSRGKKYLLNAFYGSDGLKQIEIPAGVKKIFSGSFNDIHGLENVIFASKEPITIERYCFNQMPALKTLYLYSDLEENCFVNCNSLKKLYLGKDVEKLGNNVFRDHPMLSSVTVSPENKAFTSVNGALLNYLGSSLILVPSVEHYVMPDNVTSGADNALDPYANIKTITLGKEFGYSVDSYFGSRNLLSQIFKNKNITEIKSNSDYIIERDGFLFRRQDKEKDEFTFLGTYYNNPAEEYTLTSDVTEVILIVNGYNKSFKKIIVPYKLKRLSAGAFAASASGYTFIIYDDDTNVNGLLDAITLTIVAPAGGKIEEAVKNANKSNITFISLEEYEQTGGTTSTSATTTLDLSDFPTTTTIVNDNITYEFNRESGELVISGEGEASLTVEALLSPPIDPETGEYEVVDRSRTIFDRRVFKMKKLIVNEGITALNRNDFDLSDLEEVSLPDSLTYINYYFFYHLRREKTVNGKITTSYEPYNYPSSLKFMEFPPNLKNAGNWKNVYNIKNAVFHGDTSVSELVKLDTLELAPDFPADVNIARFAEMTKTLIIPENSQNYCIYNGAVFSSDLKTLYYVPYDLNYLEIPENTENVYKTAFDRASLKALRLHSYIDLPKEINVSKIIIAEDYTSNKLPDYDMEKFELEYGNIMYYYHSGAMYSADNELVKYPGNSRNANLDIPDGITDITLSNKYLRSIKLPIGFRCFDGEKVKVNLYDEFTLIVNDPYCEVRNFTSPFLTIYGIEGGKAWEYAVENGISFISLGRMTETLYSEDDGEQLYTAFNPDIPAVDDRKTENAQTLVYSAGDLLPHTIYNIYVAECSDDVLNPDNLLYAAQRVSDESGTIEFEYIPRKNTENPYITAVPLAESKTLELSESELVLDTGDTAYVYANQRNVTLYSSDTSVVGLGKNGIVKAIGHGNAIITAINPNGDMYELPVKVNGTLELLTDDDNAVEDDVTELVMIEGETKRLGFSRNDVKIVSSDTEVIAVGENNTIKAVSAGRAVITASDKNGNELSYYVNVYKKLDVNKSIVLEINEQYSLGRLTLNDTFTSSDDQVVEVDKSGILKAKKTGNAVISVVSSSINVYEINVEVVEEFDVDDYIADMNIGDSYIINSNRPAAGYFSSDNNIVSVSSNGVISALSAGKCTVTVTDEYGKSKVITVRVGGETTSSSTQTTVPVSTETTASVLSSTASAASSASASQTTSTTVSTASTVSSEATTASTVPIQPEKYDLGNPNGDGKVDAIDASFVLGVYAFLSTGGKSDITKQQEKAADVNGDRKIDAKDASAILSYYSYTSTGGKEDLETFLKS